MLELKNILISHDPVTSKLGSVCYGYPDDNFLDEVALKLYLEDGAYYLSDDYNVYLIFYINKQAILYMMFKFSPYKDLYKENDFYIRKTNGKIYRTSWMDMVDSNDDILKNKILPFFLFYPEIRKIGLYSKFKKDVLNKLREINI